MPRKKQKISDKDDTDGELFKLISKDESMKHRIKDKYLIWSIETEPMTFVGTVDMYPLSDKKMGKVMFAPGVKKSKIVGKPLHITRSSGETISNETMWDELRIEYEKQDEDKVTNQ